MEEYTKIESQLQRKLLLSLKDEKINIDEYRKISRLSSSLFSFLTIRENESM